MVKRLLEELGCAVELACDGREAVERVARGGVDLVLMDCLMPVMDGFAAVSAIRAAEATRRTPIVGLTASEAATHRAECLSAGMDDYLTKPVEPAALRAVLARWTGLDGVAAPVAAVTVVGERLDPSRVRLYLEMGGPAFIRGLAETFRRSAEERLQAMRRALEIQDRQAAWQEAHALRGTALNLGADRLAGLLGRFAHDDAAMAMIEVEIAMACAAVDQLVAELSA